MSGVTVQGQPVKIGDPLFMVTSGQWVTVIDTSATKFTIRLQAGRTQTYESEPKISRQSDSGLFYWEDITAIKTLKGGDMVESLRMFRQLVKELEHKKVC